MKSRMLLALALVLATLSPAWSQTAGEHHGPVVFPATNSADNPQPSDTAPQPADTSGQPAATSPTQAPAPDANSVAAPPQVSPTSGAAVAQPPQNDIYDIRPPFFYIRSLFWLWIVLAAAALIALIVLLWVWFKPFRAMRAQSAYDLALEKLEKAKALLNEENPEPYAVAVSETIRSYLSQRFHAPSTRRTTEEFLRQMQNEAGTPLAEHRDLLRGFLESCDLLKFAHYQPDRDELEQVQQRAFTFVTATRPVEQNGRAA